MSLTYLERRLLDVYDRKLRRCWWCGQWAYGLDDCRACSAHPMTPRSSDLGSTSPAQPDTESRSAA